MIRALFLSAALLVLSACGGGGDGASSAPSPCPLPEADGDESLLPRELNLGQYGVVEETTVTKGFLSARIVSETKIVELYPPIAADLLEHDFQILSGDNEGFEAEIFFDRGKDESGNLYMREGPCAGQVTMTLTYGAPRYGGKS